MKKEKSKRFNEWSEACDKRVDDDFKKSVRSKTLSTAIQGHVEGQDVKTISISDTNYEIQRAVYDFIIKLSEMIYEYQFCCELNEIDVDNCIEANQIEFDEWRIAELNGEDDGAEA